VKDPRLWLMAAAWMSLVASALHVAVIVGGPDWSRFFGAGEEMARAAERGSLVPALVTLAIAAILAGWAAYAFSAAGVLRPLPLTRTALGALPSVWAPEQWPGFAIWSSLICFVLGLAFAVGVWLAWPHLSQRNV
jgi:hypothetical protein